MAFSPSNLQSLKPSNLPRPAASISPRTGPTTRYFHCPPIKVKLLTRPNNSTKASLNAISQVALITCMMSAEAPDTAGPDCWSKLELDFALVEVNRHYLHLHIDHQNHRENHQPSTSPPVHFFNCIIHTKIWGDNSEDLRFIVLHEELRSKQGALDVFCH